MMSHWCTGFTLIEVLLAAGLLIAGVCVVLFGMHFATIHSEYLAQMQVARTAAQGLLERLSALPFETLENQPLIQSYQVEDLNFNGQLDAGAGEDINGSGVLDAGALPPGALVTVQVRAAGELRDIHVAACWSHRGRFIGETDCQDANGWVESPVMVSTRIGRAE